MTDMFKFFVKDLRDNADHIRLHKQASSALGLFEKDTRIFSSFFYLKFIAVLMKAGEGLDSLLETSRY